MTSLKLHTDRLELWAGTSELAQAELADRDRLADLLQAQVPDTWPPELFVKDLLKFVVRKFKKIPGDQGEWLHWYWILQGQAAEDRTLIGLSGFSLPNSEGAVEVAYSLLGQFQGYGYAREAIARLVAWAFEQPEISRITAKTLPDKTQSIRVLNHNGFRQTGENADHGVMVYWFELTREMFERQS